MAVLRSRVSILPAVYSVVRSHATAPAGELGLFAIAMSARTGAAGAHLNRLFRRRLLAAVLVGKWGLASEDETDYGSLMNCIGLPDADVAGLRPHLTRTAGSEPLDMRPQGGLFGIGYHAQPHLVALAADRAQRRRAIVGIGAASAPLIGSTARRVIRIEVLRTFFLRVLEQFVALRRGVGQRGRGLDRFGMSLEAMAPFQDRFLGQGEFARQLGARLALKHAPQ